MRYLKILAVLCIFVCANKMIAQSYLNIVKDFDTLQNFGGVVKFYNNSFYISSGSILKKGYIQLPDTRNDIHNFNSAFSLLRTQIKPNFRYYQSYINPFSILFNSIYHTLAYDSLSIVNNLFHYISGGYMYKLKLSGDSIIGKQITDSVNRTLFYGNIILKNKTIVQIGDKEFRPVSNYKSHDLYLLLTDTNLTILDTAQYGVGLNLYKYNVFTPTFDSGFLAGGYYQIGIQDTNDVIYTYPRFFLQKYDSALTLLWTKAWSDTIIDLWGDKHTNNTILGICELTNHNIFITGTSGNSLSTKGYEYFAILNQYGIIIKQKNHSNAMLFNTDIKNYEPRQKGNGNIVTFGNSSTNAINYVPTIKEIDQDLNIVDAHNYYCPRENAKCFFNSWDATPDGGYVLLGDIYYNGNVNDVNDIWLLKLDSNMCVNTLCGPTAIEEESNTENKFGIFNVYPNPTHDNFRIDFDGKIEKIIISNTLGKEIINLNNYVKNNLIDVHHLSNGVYFIRVYLEDSSVIYKRLIVTQ